MASTKNKSSVAVVKNSKGRVVGYLSNRDIENGRDISLDMAGYTIESI